MNELNDNISPPPEIAPNLNNNHSNEKVVELPPPELLHIDQDFANLLGYKSVEGLIFEKYTSDYIEAILNIINQDYTLVHPGIRAVLYALREGVQVAIDTRGGMDQIATLSAISANGGEKSGLSTLVTRPNNMTEYGNPDTDMTKQYLRFSIRQAMDMKDGEVGAAILVYDLDKTTPGEGIFDINFMTEADKRESLKTIYPVNFEAFKTCMEKYSNLQPLT